MSNRSAGILVLCYVNPVGHRHVTPRVSVFRLRILFQPFSFCRENDCMLVGLYIYVTFSLYSKIIVISRLKWEIIIIMLTHKGTTIVVRWYHCCKFTQTTLLNIRVCTIHFTTHCHSSWSCYLLFTWAESWLLIIVGYPPLNFLLPLSSSLFLPHTNSLSLSLPLSVFSSPLRPSFPKALPLDDLHNDL